MHDKSKPGPVPGSEGAKKISEAHKGSHDHDQLGGFAADPVRAREIGRRGGNAVKRKYGPQYYHDIGARGGNVVLQERGPEFYAEIGRRGGLERARRIRARRAADGQENSSA